MVFGEVVRKWRRVRKLSQFELALMASVSQRHLSCLETGRSRPSRPMVMQLAEALDIPLRDRNELLSAAGFSKIYQERGLDSDQMASVRAALEQILDKQEPYPCIVVDRFWNIIKTNRAMHKLMQIVGELELDNKSRSNLALLTLHPKGLRPFIENFDQAVAPFVQRLHRDMLRYSDAETEAFYDRVKALVGDIDVETLATDEPLMPTLALELRVGEIRISLFSVIATFGTPQDVTTDEIRIESFFPADEQSKLYLQALASH